MFCTFHMSFVYDPSEMGMSQHITHPLVPAFKFSCQICLAILSNPPLVWGLKRRPLKRLRQLLVDGLGLQHAEVERHRPLHCLRRRSPPRQDCQETRAAKTCRTTGRVSLTRQGDKNQGGFLGPLQQEKSAGVGPRRGKMQMCMCVTRT